jgi:hypothetical protein
MGARAGQKTYKNATVGVQAEKKYFGLCYKLCRLAAANQRHQMPDIVLIRHPRAPAVSRRAGKRTEYRQAHGNQSVE